MKSSSFETRVLNVLQSRKLTASEIASDVEQQNDATAEIARNAQEAATRTSEVSRSIDGVREAAAPFLRDRNNG